MTAGHKKWVYILWATIVLVPLVIAAIYLGSLIRGKTIQDEAAEYGRKGVKLFREGKLKEASEAFEKALELNPKDAGIHYQLAMTYENMGRTNLAIKHYKSTIQLMPKAPEPHYNLAAMYKSRNELDKAIKELKIAIDLNPKFTGAYLTLAEYLALKGKLDQAEKYYREVMRIGKQRFDLVEAHNGLAKIYIEKGMVDAAIAEWQKTLKLDPENKEARRGIKERGGE
ncbi:MAG: tetratricopeptide repeat protein [Actinomycetota bacterium]|nr:tetratricopeptide repeat protein [Actinomycetota bacterium]MDI6821830.1 tetratricopeptide repeat protein [Actinomycetota bacterium]